MTFRLTTSLRRRLADWRHPKGYRIAERGGATWLLNHRHYIDRQMLFEGDYEAAQRQRLFALANELGCQTFLDVGANFGLYSVHAAQSERFAAIHAFEPDPRNLVRLRTNLLLNEALGTVFVHEYAVSDKDGHVTFAPGGEGFSGQSRVVSEKLSNSSKIEAHRLDSMPWQGSGFCLKVDVEGHEMAVLEGSRGLLEGQKWVIQVECLDKGGDAVVAFLKGLGAVEAGRLGEDHYFVRR